MVRKKNPTPSKSSPIDPKYGKEETLFDVEEAHRQRDEAMERIEEHASDEWKSMVMDGLLALARSMEEFTSDDLLVHLGDPAGDVHDMRALGPMFRRANSYGWISATKRFVPCKRPSRHGAPIRVWESVLLKHRLSGI
jgi:hypothetical protein